MIKGILFVSTNIGWGGSEILWKNLAIALKKKAFLVKCAVKYDANLLADLVTENIEILSIRTTSISLPFRIINKLRKSKLTENVFYRVISETKPDLVVISQGNNVDGNLYMKACREKGIPFITITQLVTEMLWTFVDDQVLNELRANYSKSRMNYFVSRENLNIHNKMLGEEFKNSTVIQNPVTISALDVPPYPSVDGVYRLALVGRLDTYHKGHDILIEIIAQEKWKSRPIIISVYGSGPHQQLIERMAASHGLKNLIFKGHSSNVTDIWKDNHLLILPSRMEGQSLALLEAMWCGRAAITTNVGGVSELIEHGKNGFVSKFASVESLDQAMEEAWNSREMWELFGMEAAKKVRLIYSDPIGTFLRHFEKVVLH